MNDIKTKEYDKKQNKMQEQHRNQAIIKYLALYANNISILPFVTAVIIVIISIIDNDLKINFLRALEIAFYLSFEMLSLLMTILIPLITIDITRFQASANGWEDTLKQLYNNNRKIKFKIFITVATIQSFILIGKISLWVDSIYYKEDAYVPTTYIQFLLIISIILSIIFVCIHWGPIKKSCIDKIKKIRKVLIGK